MTHCSDLRQLSLARPSGDRIGYARTGKFQLGLRTPSRQARKGRQSALKP